MKDFGEITWLISQNVKWGNPPPPFIKQRETFEYVNGLTLSRRRNGVPGRVEDGSR